MMEAQNLFANLRVNITAEGKRHLGPVIESIEYRHKHMKDLVKDWDTHFVSYCKNTTASSLFSIC